ncbi:hypothetical protein E0E54_15505 [Azotobacter chroococcum]|nr:hypothetical protein E0E54_15505 [Azotobacter chroococcum]
MQYQCAKREEPGDWHQPINPARFGSDPAERVTGESQERSGHEVLQPVGQGVPDRRPAGSLSEVPRQPRCGRGGRHDVQGHRRPRIGQLAAKTETGAAYRTVSVRAPVACMDSQGQRRATPTKIRAANKTILGSRPE